MVVLANRNGFYYALDRVTGKFIAGRPYVKQTWATGLDEAGRPLRVPGAEPTAEGKLIWPSLGGGSNALGLLGSAARGQADSRYGRFAAESSKPRVELNRRLRLAL